MSDYQFPTQWFVFYRPNEDADFPVTMGPVPTLAAAQKYAAELDLQVAVLRVDLNRDTGFSFMREVSYGAREHDDGPVAVWPNEAEDTEAARYSCKTRWSDSPFNPSIAKEEEGEEIVRPTGPSAGDIELWFVYANALEERVKEAEQAAGAEADLVDVETIGRSTLLKRSRKLTDDLAQEWAKVKKLEDDLSYWKYAFDLEKDKANWEQANAKAKVEVLQEQLAEYQSAEMLNSSAVSLLHEARRERDAFQAQLDGLTEGYDRLEQTHENCPREMSSSEVPEHWQILVNAGVDTVGSQLQWDDRDEWGFQFGPRLVLARPKPVVERNPVEEYLVEVIADAMDGIDTGYQEAAKAIVTRFDLTPKAEQS